MERFFGSESYYLGNECDKSGANVTLWHWRKELLIREWILVTMCEEMR